MYSDTKEPYPGTPEATEKGCLCLVGDNRHGKGVYVDDRGKVAFWITEGCPIHAPFPLKDTSA